MLDSKIDNIIEKAIPVVMVQAMTPGIYKINDKLYKTNELVWISRTKGGAEVPVPKEYFKMSSIKKILEIIKKILL